MSAQKVIEIAKKEVGTREGFANGSYNNRQKYSPAVPGLEWSQNQPWCATFVAWCAMQAGVASLYPRTASCDVGGNWFKERKRWSEYPAIGAQVFFGTPADLNHTGIVYNYDANYIYTIEGNTNDSGSREGNGVYLKKRARRDANVVGYGYPAFEGGIQSADPKFAKPKVSQPDSPAKPATQKKNNVEKAHVRFKNGLSLLEKADDDRTKVKEIAKQISALVNKLPEK